MFWGAVIVARRRCHLDHPKLVEEGVEKIFPGPKPMIVRQINTGSRVSVRDKECILPLSFSKPTFLFRKNTRFLSSDFFFYYYFLGECEAVARPRINFQLEPLRVERNPGLFKDSGGPPHLGGQFNLQSEQDAESDFN